MPVGNCHLKEFELQPSNMREADDEFLIIPFGVDRLLPTVLEELESGDQLELEWVWPCLPLSTHGGMYVHLIRQVGGKVQHREL